MLGITDLKVGKNIVLDGQPYVVTWNQHSKQARGAGVMKTKLKNLLTGRALERTFQGSDKIEGAEIQFKRAQYLYQSGTDYEFMDQESFENVSFSEEVLGDDKFYLQDGMDVDIQYFNGNPINLKFPPKLTFEIAQTDPGVTGDRAQAGTKPATCVGGLTLQVPMFVEKGEKIVVNTINGEYVERAK